MKDGYIGPLTPVQQRNREERGDISNLWESARALPALFTDPRFKYLTVAEVAYNERTRIFLVKQKSKLEKRVRNLVTTNLAAGLDALRLLTEQEKELANEIGLGTDQLAITDSQTLETTLNPETQLILSQQSQESQVFGQQPLQDNQS